MKIKDILQTASDSLTSETWEKSDFFSLGLDGQIRMSAHGAVQRIVNPKVKEILQAVQDEWLRLPKSSLLGSPALGIGEAWDPIHRALELAHSAASTGSLNEDLEETISFTDGCDPFKFYQQVYQNTWNKRPIWIDLEDSHYGNFSAHYLLGIVGLTSWCNNAEGTTLSDIKEKFRQAIVLAESLKI